MPEFPDVALFRRYLDATALGRKIRNVVVKDDYVVRETGAARLARRARGARLVGSRQHGKYLFARTDRDGWIVFHFGMTGFFRHLDAAEPDPPHGRVFFVLDGGDRLVFVCPRRLGRVGWVDDPDRFIASRRLGLDPSSPELTREQFRRLVGGRKGAVKPLLMSQRIVAGLGNIYVDETLFHAGVHPLERVEDLGPGELDRVFRSLMSVIEEALAAEVDADRFPARCLLPRRAAGETCPRCGGEIERIQVGGRSTYYCARHQRH